ncbi:hypothetical protein H0H81_005118, partial [Sphagnurus paluster]
MSAQISNILEEKKDVEAFLARVEAKRDEWRRKFNITDSRRKILELETHRPQWEEARKQRERKVQEEAAEAESAQRRAELEESERKMRELLAEERRRKDEEKLKKERQEAERRAQEAKAEEERRRALAQEQARRQAWTAATNAEHRSVPWPVLERSVLSSNSDELKVTCGDVHGFFDYVKSEYRRTEEYNKLVTR